MKFSEARCCKYGKLLGYVLGNDEIKCICGSINLISLRVSEPHEIELIVESVPERLCTKGV